MGIIVGGPKAWKVRRHGDVVVAFHWLEKEPAMVLFPVTKRLGAAAFIIPLHMAHTYAKPDGYPTKEAMEKCFVAAQVMAMDTTKSTIHCILTAILDNLEDLIRMPPQPPEIEQGRRAVGEVSLLVGGKTVSQGEVLDLPPQLTH